MGNTETTIELATRRAIRTDDEATRIEALTSLNGASVSPASALLFFAFPNDYPILE